MTVSQFWDLIDKSRNEAGGWQDMEESLANILSELDISEIIIWYQIFYEYHQRADKSKLWAATYVINGGCSDDGFTDFRGWLIAQGKDVFLNALLNPATLEFVDNIHDDYCAFEEILYVADKACCIKTGEDEFNIWDIDADPLPADLIAKIDSEIKYDDDIDIEWNEDTLHKLFPSLCKAFNWNVK